jgi:hypothetical protein
MAYILAGLILYSAAAKSLAPPSWIILSTLRRTNTARLGVILAEFAVVAGLLAQGWAAATTAALFGAAAAWWRAKHPAKAGQGCGCFGARRPSPPGPSWLGRARTAALLVCIVGSIMTALIPAANPHTLVIRIALILMGAALGHLLWPLKDLWFSNTWLRQNADPAVARTVVWTAPLSVSFGLRGVTVRMMALATPPFADIAISWLPSPLSYVANPS